MRICLPTQKTWVQSLIREDPTWYREGKSFCHNYEAYALDPRSHECWAHVPQLVKPACLRARPLQQEKPLQWEALALQLKKSPPINEVPAQPKKKKSKISAFMHMVSSQISNHINVNFSQTPLIFFFLTMVKKHMTNLPAVQETQKMWVQSLVRKIPWRRKW